MQSVLPENLPEDGVAGFGGGEGLGAAGELEAEPLVGGEAFHFDAVSRPGPHRLAVTAHDFAH